MIGNPMRIVTCDIETNGLDPTIVWCVVAKDINTGEVFTFKNPFEVQSKFPEFSKTVDKWIGHNFITYDAPVLMSLVPNVSIPVSKIIDTLVMSRLFNIQRKAERLANGKYSQHSLEAWAIRLNRADITKVQNDVWTEYSDTIVERCISDVDITEATYNFLIMEGKDFSEESIRLEHNVAYINDQQKRRGFKVNQDILYPLQDSLIAKERELRELIIQHFPPLPKFIREVTPKFNKNGKLSTVGLSNIPPEQVKGSFSLIDWIPFNMGSTQQVVERMNRLGWKPYIFTEKGQAQVNDENLATLPSDAPLAGKLFTDYRTVTGRLNKIKEIFDGLDQEDFRVHGDCVHIGASTHRMAHSRPNMANVPSVDAPFGGAELREMFMASEGFVLLGTDASGIQLRLLAHYINDPEFTKVLLNEDIHNYMASIYLGIPVDQITKEQRRVGKTLTYAICFGAGAQRAASIFGISVEQGQEMIDRVQKRIPGLARVKNDGRQAANRGYTEGVDGRLLPVLGSHLYLPALLQGGEQSVMKLAKCLWYKRANLVDIPMYDYNKQRTGFKAAVVADVHDEWQTEVQPDVAEQLGKLQVWAIEEAGRRLNLNCPLTGAYRIGANWKLTH